MDLTGFVRMAPLCPFNTKATTDNAQTSNNGCVPISLSLQISTMDHFGPMGHSFLTLDLNLYPYYLHLDCCYCLLYWWGAAHYKGMSTKYLFGSCLSSAEMELQLPQDCLQENFKLRQNHNGYINDAWHKMTEILIENNLRSLFLFYFNGLYISVLCQVTLFLIIKWLILSFEIRKICFFFQICSSFPKLFWWIPHEFNGEKQFSTNDTVWWKRLFSYDAVKIGYSYANDKVQPLPYIVYKINSNKIKCIFYI